MKVEIEVTAKRRTAYHTPHAAAQPISRRQLMSPSSQIHAKISGPIVMIGFGSIGKGTLPLIERHFEYDKSRFVISIRMRMASLRKSTACASSSRGVTRDNYRELLVPLLTAGGGQGFCVNLSVDTSSVDIMTLCREIGVLDVDTVIEPWAGFYFDKNIGTEQRSNYALRETLLASRAQEPGRHHGRLHLRRQPGHGVLVRQAGAARYRPRHQSRNSTSRTAGRAGPSSPRNSASRASTSPSATPSAPRSRSR